MTGLRILGICPMIDILRYDKPPTHMDRSRYRALLVYVKVSCSHLQVERKVQTRSRSQPSWKVHFFLLFWFFVFIHCFTEKNMSAFQNLWNYYHSYPKNTLKYNFQNINREEIELEEAKKHQIRARKVGETVPKYKVPGMTPFYF